MVVQVPVVLANLVNFGIGVSHVAGYLVIGRYGHYDIVNLFYYSQCFETKHYATVVLVSSL